VEEKCVRGREGGRGGERKVGSRELTETVRGRTKMESVY